MFNQNFDDLFLPCQGSNVESCVAFLLIAKKKFAKWEKQIGHKKNIEKQFIGTKVEPSTLHVHTVSYE